MKRITVCHYDTKVHQHKAPLKSNGEDDEDNDDIKEGRDDAKEDELSASRNG
jgi:hypothetical protein